ESLWETLQVFPLMDKLIKAAAAHPTDREMLCEAVQFLKEQFQDVPTARPIVQTHGRFRHEHIFISREAVSIIDLDQSHPADPARDAAEFLHALRWDAFKIGYDLEKIDKACRAFIKVYLSQVSEAAPALTACWSASTFLTLLRYAKRTHTPEAERRRQVEFLLGEIRSIAKYGI
ncbi:MAG TPA: hypothetical protein VEF04_02580, partial [Blastocatellia bacterium]|nr:hypothetical protein [Blastocatellia bacterium]